jgi:hypothetical protein
MIAKLDVMLTTDDQFLRNAKKYSKKIQIEIDNPINWIQNLI